MNILITGANGFIGKALCSRLASDNRVIGIDITRKPDKSANITWEQADPPATRCEALRAGLTDLNSVTAICEKYSPDVVIHCAGVAHQKIDPQITPVPSAGATPYDSKLPTGQAGRAQIYADY